MINFTQKSPITLFIPGLEGGGAQRVFVSLANTLVDISDRPVQVLVIREGGVFAEHLRPEVELINLGTERVSRSLFALISFMRKNKSHVFCSTLNYCNLLSVIAWLLAGKVGRLVIREANVVSSVGPGMRLLMKWTYPRADAVVGLSPEVSKSILEAGIPVANKIVEIGNPANFKLIAQNPPKPDFLPDPVPPFICAVGSLTRQKGFDVLLSAFSQIKDTNLHLVILGEGELRQDLEQQLRELNIENRVYLPGFVARPTDILQKAELFVLSSRWEGFPNVLLEALMSGVPIVATSCEGASVSILEQGKHGHLVVPDDPDALAMAIEVGLHNPIGTVESRRSRAQDFSVEKIARAYLEKAFEPIVSPIFTHIIADLGNGGAESVLYRLCTADNPERHRVVSMMGLGKYGPLLEAKGVQVSCLDMPSGRVSLSGLWRLYCLLRKEKPVVVQTWMYHADLVGGVVARLAGIRNICWNIRHSELEPGKSKRSTIWVAKACAMLSKWVPKKVICCAEKAKQVHVNYGYDSTKMLVVGNGYNLDQFKPDQNARKKLRSELGLSDDVLLLGMVGRFNVQKNHHGLLKSLCLLKERGISFVCALVGTDMCSDNQLLVSWIEECGLQGDVLLLNQRSDIHAVMNALDIHVFSSSFGEGFPNVLAEAMACGVPCVTTDSGDAALIVGDTGWVVPVLDEIAFSNNLYEAIIEWKNEPACWQKRSEATVKRVTQNFSLEKMIQAYYSVWNAKF